jgi:hypothetical protein
MISIQRPVALPSLHFFVMLVLCVCVCVCVACVNKEGAYFIRVWGCEKRRGGVGGRCPTACAVTPKLNKALNSTH